MKTHKQNLRVLSPEQQYQDDVMDYFETLKTRNQAIFPSWRQCYLVVTMTRHLMILVFLLQIPVAVVVLSLILVNIVLLLYHIQYDDIL